MVAFITEAYLRTLPVGFQPGTYPDSVNLNELIETASEFVQEYIDHVVAPTVVVERIVGTDRYTLLLDEYPIISVSGITSIGYTTTETLDPAQFLVRNNAGILEWISKTRAFSSDRIFQVTYTAGYLEIPRSIKRATALQVYEMLQPMFVGNANDVIPETTQQFVDLLEPFRRKRLS